MVVVIGVNHTSIYSVFFMCLCNLNARFTPIFLKITLIPICLCFAGMERKSSKEREKSIKGRTCCSMHWFATTRRFAKAKERLRLGEGGIIRR